MKVIFLDFNGVLDTYEKMNEIDSENLKRLKKIVDLTGAKIVISSSIKNSYWYLGCMSTMLKMLVDTLTENGMEVIGFTPLCKSREEEIISYLESNDDISNYVILDDDYDMPLLQDHLVKLPSQSIGITQTGLQDEHVEEAINILGVVLEVDDNKKLVKRMESDVNDNS